jgi:hypothetical protein
MDEIARRNALDIELYQSVKRRLSDMIVAEGVPLAEASGELDRCMESRRESVAELLAPQRLPAVSAYLDDLISDDDPVHPKNNARRAAWG